ncbi:energy transducer TonB [Horticoccus sp. 23ND18S-11]|uniref:energy transducer TonB n=1 Tax=Horticoccus sp. 23ND18S-11 TaxID=3391832 RepID=UPI0039C9E0CF
MITHYPFPLSAPAAEPPARLTNPAAPADKKLGSWRYVARPVSRVTIATALLISAGVHLALLFGIRHTEKKVVVPVEERIILMTLAMPDLKDLEEPETVVSDERATPVDLTVPVPMQADLPQLPQPNDFVQPLNFASLLEQPDFSALKVSVIPENFRSGAKLAEKIGKIFELVDLDRTPEPVLQSPPRYPVAMRRDGASGRVMVEFIVDTEGKVLEPYVIDTTNPGFNEAAVAGVARWKFRAGQRGGRKVNVRMRVPIVFRVEDGLE